MNTQLMIFCVYVFCSLLTLFWLLYMYQAYLDVRQVCTVGTLQIRLLDTYEQVGYQFDLFIVCSVVSCLFSLILVWSIPVLVSNLSLFPV